jgi:beta-glucosidase
MTASVTVKNIGNHVGKEAVQIYVNAPDGGLVKPAIELRSFAKTKELAPGQSQRITVTIDPYTLASFNENASEWQTAAGDYKIYFAASSEDLKVSAVAKEPKTFSWRVHQVLLPKEKVNEIKVK